jgi:hypothetical protein
MNHDEGEFMMADWLASLEKQGWAVVPCSFCGDDALLSPDGKLTACAFCDSNWAIAVFEKESAMKVADYLSRVRAMRNAEMNARREAEKEAQERLEEFKDEVKAFLLTKLPNEVHPYVSSFYYDEEEAQMVFKISLPECAAIEALCVAHIDAEHGHKTMALAKKGWRNTCFEVVQNEVRKNYEKPLGEDYQREIVARVMGEFGKDEFDQAVSLALVLGPERIDQDLLDEMNDDLAEKAVQYDRIPLCPLMIQGETYQKCVGEKCAWFISYKSENMCAMKALGHAAQHTMPVEL